MKGNSFKMTKEAQMQGSTNNLFNGRAEGMIKKLEKNVNQLIQESVLAGSVGDHQTVSATHTHPI